MKVRLLISRAGARGVQKVGDEIEVSEREAKRLMEAVPPKAVPVREIDLNVEQATVQPRRPRRGRVTREEE